jgi:Cytochrome c biogenesis protein
VKGVPDDISPGQAIDLTIPSVIVAAIVDSINPCAFAVLIFLLVYLTSLQVRNRILTVGTAYILTVFIVYFLSGLGFFVLIQTAGITDIVFNVAAIIAILAGIINLKDFFWYGRGISLSIPESRKESIKHFVLKASIPSAILLGGLVSMVELPCTGGIYLAILGLLSSRMTIVQGIPYLLIYNAIFVLPLIVILLGVYYGVSPERMESWRGEEKRWMRLAMGCVMIALGALMLFGML